MTYSHFCFVLNLKQQKPSSKKDQEVRNNSEAAMRNDRICYELFRRGRPFTDYPNMVILFVKSNIFMGDTNHSAEFPAKFISSVAEVVRSKMKKCLIQNLYKQVMSDHAR